MANIQCNDTDQLCPDTCDDFIVPSVSFDDCAPEINESEIEWIAVANKDASDFEDVEDAEEWTTRINQTAPESGTDDSIRMIRVIGDKPAPEETEITISGNRTQTTGATHTANFDIDETNTVNYEFIRKLQCNTKVKLWYITRGNKVYGGICGLKAKLKARLVQNRGNGEIEKFTGTFVWEDKIDPPRAEWPLAGTTNFQTPTT
jgi:hypothetical protein